MMPSEAVPPPSAQRTRMQSDPAQLLQNITQMIETKSGELHRKTDEYTELKQKRSQYHVQADALGYTVERLQILAAEIRMLQEKLREASALRAAVLERAPAVVTAQPEPQPEPEPGQLGQLPIKMQISTLRQKLACTEEELKRCKRSARVSERHRVSTLSDATKSMRVQLEDLGFQDPGDHPPWCMEAAERARRGLPLRVLSIDGGGIKGLVPAIIMERIEDMCGPHKIHELFDLVVGTSTGGVLALGTCAAKVPVQVMTDVYENHADEIWRKAGSSVSQVLTSTLGVAGQALSGQKWAYDPSGLEAILKQNSAMSGSATTTAMTRGANVCEQTGEDEELHQLPLLNPDPGTHPKVCVVASQEDRHGFNKLLFRTYQPEVERSRAVYAVKMWEAARATSAAPSFFPPHVLADGTQCVDGGIIANNPVKIAQDEAADIWCGRPVGLLVSLGCGRSAKYTQQGAEEEGTDGGGGVLAVAKKAKNQMTNTQIAHEDILGQLVPTVMNGGAGPAGPTAVGDQLGRTWTSTLEPGLAKYGGVATRPRDANYNGCLYLRLNPPLPRSVKMDTADPADLALLRTSTEDFLSEPETIRRLQEMCGRLRAHPDASPATHVQPSAPPTTSAALVAAHTPVPAREQVVVMAHPVAEQVQPTQPAMAYSTPEALVANAAKAAPDPNAVTTPVPTQSRAIELARRAVELDQAGDHLNAAAAYLVAADCMETQQDARILRKAVEYRTRAAELSATR